jgi:hypothetical protein
MRVVKSFEKIANRADKRNDVVFQIDHGFTKSRKFESSWIRAKTKWAFGDKSNCFDRTQKWRSASTQ